MRSAIVDILPAHVRRSLQQMGSDIGLARRKRGLTVQMVAERISVSRGTYLRLEHGDPRVALGVYAMTLYVFGLGTPLAELVDPSRDDRGLLLGDEHVPKRVRPKRDPAPR